MRILFIGMAESIHVLRWLNQLQDERWDLHLFPSTLNPPLPDLRNITLHDVAFSRPGYEIKRLSRFVKIDGIYWSRLKRLWNLPRGGAIGRRIMRRVKPPW